MSFLDSLDQLDSNNPGLWPAPIKITIFVIAFIAILFSGWQFDITNQREELASLEKQEKERLDVLDFRQRKAANLDVLKEQMKEIEQSFGDMVRQLPDKTEVAGLLIDISQTGLSSGLEFKLFEPKNEIPKEFYAELPINISIVGEYHQFGEFISGVAALPRIVTTHDIKISRITDNESDNDDLQMDAVAKTYRAIEEEEEEEEEE